MLNLTCGSLFSGCGLGDLGIEWAGFEHRWFCEVDNYARQVLAKRWPGREIYNDIQEVDFSKVEQVDLLTGGFPCQDISLGGKGAGINGNRSGLWKEFARAVGEIRPGFVLVENSPALTKRGLWRVLGDLSEVGFDAEWRCIPAAAFGAPHKRDRIWIVGYSRSLRRKPRRKNHREHDGAILAPDGQHAGEMADSDSSRELQSEGLRQERGRSCNCGEKGKVSDPKSFKGHEGRCSDNPQSRQLSTKAGRTHSQIPHPANKRLQGSGEPFYSVHYAEAGERKTAESFYGRFGGVWSPEPGLGRVADGVPHRVDRLKGLGNGQLPHCTYYLGRIIRQAAYRIGYVPVAEAV